MRPNLLRTVGAAAILAALSGCSSGTDAPPEPTTTTTTTTTTSTISDTTTAAAPPAPGEVEVSPGGVTTAVGAPAESTEDDYFQACRAARTWMDQRGGDPSSQVEPYLKSVQSAQTTGPGTFGRRWSDLSPGQQSAVIVAVEAAADALCG